MRVYIETRRDGGDRQLVIGLHTQPTPANSKGKTLTAAAVTIAIAVAFYLMVLTDLDYPV